MAGVDFRGFRPKNVWPRRSPRGGGEATDCAGMGFGTIRAGGFLPVKAAAGGKGTAGAYTFAVAELAPSMTLKSYWVQKPWALKVMQIMAPRSHSM